MKIMILKKVCNLFTYVTITKILVVDSHENIFQTHFQKKVCLFSNLTAKYRVIENFEI